MYLYPPLSGEIKNTAHTDKPYKRYAVIYLILLRLFAHQILNVFLRIDDAFALLELIDVL